MTLTVLAAFAGALFAGILAAVALLRNKFSVVLWAFVATMVILSIESILSGLSIRATTLDTMVYWQTWRLIAMSLLPGVWLIFSLSYARQNPTEFLARSWSLLLVAILAPIGLVFAFHGNMIAAGDLIQVKGVFCWAIRFSEWGIAEHVFVLASAVVALMNLERTFRASVGTMRWRIKFMVLGFGLLLVARAYMSSQVLLFQGMVLPWEYAPEVLLLTAPLILCSLLRTGQFEVDVYLSHTFLYNSVTLLLAGIYLFMVGVMAKVVTYLGKTEALPLKAFLVLLSLVLLTILLLSDRVRMQTKRFISRHFRRSHNDYRKIWLEFSKETACCEDQTELCRRTIKLVVNILDSLSVGIWLLDENKDSLVFAASTSLSEKDGGKLGLSSADVREVINALQNHRDPIEIGSSNERWALLLRDAHPDEFGMGGGQVCVPLVAGSELLGVMMLGDRVSGVDFSIEDMDLLKCIGEQIAANLRNFQLSQSLSQAKELEAFQAMSAFLVHDLKNTSSTLGLMVKNLPCHFDDPAFREDALRAITKSVAHINHMIQRFGQLRQTLEIEPQEADLNEFISKLLLTWRDEKNVALKTELRPVPKVFLDSEQFGMVVTNLMINAIEARRKGGEVRVETSQENGSVVLSVADTGCGMSPEFLNRSLFRPFQSSKKGGFGIGMFQSKVVVEAHGGKIEVQSEIGKGTTFRILLPYRKV